MMIWSRIPPSVVFLTFIASGSIAHGQPCECESWDDAPGVLWAGCSPLTLREVAAIAAPALWFTGDEPLLIADDAAPMPTNHPCDAPADGAVVYYQVTELVRRDAEITRPPDELTDVAEAVESLVLKFFFYYPRDFGLGGHPHDLEAVEFHMLFERRDGCYRVRMESAEGLAHGSRWYSNLLEIERDTRFPLTVFVEEGKHASALDRNADGRFTRGYDVNRQVNDAWGVRDVMGAGVLLTSAYNAEMTKPREHAHRVLPPETPLLKVRPANSSLQLDDEHLYRYELRPGSRVPVCEDMGENRRELVSMMDYHGYGDDKEPRQYNSFQSALKDVRSPQRWLSFSLRVDDHLGLGLVFKGLDLDQGWILPKVTVSPVDASASALFTPSASRFFDYYVSGGVRRQFDSEASTVEVVTENGRREITVIEPPQWNFVSEVGLKLRARVPRTARVFTLGYHFAGVRLGVQSFGFGSLDNIRLIFEIGAGAW